MADPRVYICIGVCLVNLVLVKSGSVCLEDVGEISFSLKLAATFILEEQPSIGKCV